ncbi:MAG: hypothetical protein EA401_11820 [Planctomycetota bacterium]|nr:MAG: hypothetical protein EA401_11820 [Planctomycetota bacterium]
MDPSSFGSGQEVVSPGVPCYACASAPGGARALLRVAGISRQTLEEWLGLSRIVPWRPFEGVWPLASGGGVPMRLLWCPGPRSFTGDDLCEITVPGSSALIEVVQEDLQQRGLEQAQPGYFARRALANGRLRLDQAEALLAVVHARDGSAARRAVALLRGGLGDEVAELRQRLLHQRALVEAGLDFMEEADVRAYEPAALQAELRDVAGCCRRWLRAAASQEHIPTVVLAGKANAGKSALFNVLTHGDALVSDTPGTTRDWLDGAWQLPQRGCRLVDTAGWLDAHVGTTALDQQAIARGKALLHGAAVVLWCSAPDAPLPQELPDIPGPSLLVANKSDLGIPHHQAPDIAVSAKTGAGLEELAHIVDEYLAPVAGLPRRQHYLLQQAAEQCQVLSDRPLPDDVCLAADLRSIADLLGELIGTVTSDEILGTIFGQFCIGK